MARDNNKARRSKLANMTTHRNWCHYWIRGMVAGIDWIAKSYPGPHIEQTKRQLWSLMYAVDAAYYDRTDKLRG